MELISAVLSTALGKAAASLAVAGASVGGLHAAEVVDVPMLPDTAQEEQAPVEEVPADGPTVADAAKEKGDQDIEEASEEDEAEDLEIEAEAEAEPELDEGERQATGASGMDVATDAQDGGVDGQSFSEDVVATTPAADKADPGAPEDPAAEGQERRDAAPVPEQAGDDADDLEVEEEQDVESEDEDDAPAAQAEDRNPTTD